MLRREFLLFIISGAQTSLNDKIRKKGYQIHFKSKSQWKNVFMENARTSNFSAFPVSWWAIYNIYFWKWD